MQTFFTQIGRLFQHKPQAQTTTQGPVLASSSADTNELANRFRADTERKEIIETCRKMYKADPRVKKMHTTLARDLVKGGFVVKCNNERARKIATDLQTRLSLNQRCEDYGRLTARDGDSFIEIGVDQAMNITEITRKPTLKMHRMTNDADQFVDPARAFWLGDSSGYSTAIPKNAIWFAEWQMIHLRWDHDEENRYGTPMMSTATSAYRRVHEGETDVAVRRKTRSGIRYVHVVEGSQGDIEAYKQVNEQALKSPFAAVVDFFTSKKGTIEVIEGEGSSLEAIGDVLHHIETMGMASDVPLALIGYGGDLNRDVLGEKKAEYEETLDQLREWMTENFIKPLLERQWLLQGILPESVQYSIIWRPRVNITPVLIRDLADALLKLKLLNVPEEDINAILTYFLPGVEIDALTAAATAGGDSERLAGMLKGLTI